MRPLLSGKHLCVCVWWNNEIGLKQGVVIYTSPHSHSKNQWNPTQMEIYTLPAALHFCAKTRVFPVGWDPLHSSLRKKEKEEGTVNYIDGGNCPTGRGREMKRCNYEEETKCWNPVWTGQSFVSEGKSSSESTFSRISSHLYQEQHLITAVQTTWGSVALIQHNVNNWCASKHWRYMHTWSECINSTCGWSTLFLSLGGFINLFCRQLVYLFSIFTATSDQ